jgi:hypothetical protein
MNYRPVSNLFTASKIFKLILKRILKIQDECGVDLTGSNQHEFKKRRSTYTLSVTLQSIIARALNEGKCFLVSSLNLSSAFDVVNIDLLPKRLKIVGKFLLCKYQWCKLSCTWSTARYYPGINSWSDPVCNIGVSPVWLWVLPAFVDDNYIPKFNTLMNCS